MKLYEFEILDGADSQKGLLLTISFKTPRGGHASVRIPKTLALAIGLAIKEKDDWGDTVIRHKAPKSAKVIFEVES